MKAACQILSKFLPQPGVIAERKYALRTSQEKKLEHSLSVLDAAVYQDLDTAEILEAKRCLVMLAPVIQVSSLSSRRLLGLTIIIGVTP